MGYNSCSVVRRDLEDHYTFTLVAQLFCLELLLLTIFMYLDVLTVRLVQFIIQTNKYTSIYILFSPHTYRAS
jgi:hypothetical protein